MAQLRIEISEEAGVRPILVEELSVHFRDVELPLKAYSPRHGYLSVLSSFVLPRWGQCSLLSIESMEVEIWIRNLKTKNGNPASPRDKIQGAKSDVLFSHAI